MYLISLVVDALSQTTTLTKPSHTRQHATRRRIRSTTTMTEYRIRICCIVPLHQATRPLYHLLATLNMQSTRKNKFMLLNLSYY